MVNRDILSIIFYIYLRERGQHSHYEFQRTEFPRIREIQEIKKKSESLKVKRMMTPFPRERNQSSRNSSSSEENCLEDILDFSTSGSPEVETIREVESNEFISTLKSKNTISEDGMLDVLYSNTTPDFHTHKQLFIECKKRTCK